MIDELTQPGGDRRNFFRKASALVAGSLAMLAPAGAGLAVLLDPLRRKGDHEGGAVMVTRLAALPADGIPRRFKVVADRTDAWNRYRSEPVGAVFLRRMPEDKVIAFNASCPHASCSVDFSPGSELFKCPCHDSSFAMDGSISDPASPSPRPLDELGVEIRNQDEVWVFFRNFQPGHKEKIPVA